MNRILAILALSAIILPASENIAQCRGCAAGKLMLRCDYYFVKQGKAESRSACLDYAKVVDLDGANAKAAWYYLLGGEPEKAEKSSRRAVELGQVFANEYLAYALLILGKENAAKDAMKRFSEGVKHNGFAIRDRKILEKIYPDLDFRALNSEQ